MSLNTAISTARAKLATLDREQVAGLDETLAVDFDEHFQYQQLQAESHAAGRLPTEEALVIYAALGEVGSASNGGWVSVLAATESETQMQTKKNSGWWLLVGCVGPLLLPFLGVALGMLVQAAI